MADEYAQKKLGVGKATVVEPTGMEALKLQWNSFVPCVFKLKSQITTWFLCYPLKLIQEITLLLNTVPLNSHQMEPVLNLFTSGIQLKGMLAHYKKWYALY